MTRGRPSAPRRRTNDGRPSRGGSKHDEPNHEGRQGRSRLGALPLGFGLVFALTLTLGPAAAGPSPSAGPAVEHGDSPPGSRLFADCHRQVAAAPDAYESYLCFFLAVRTYDRSSQRRFWQQAAAEVAALETTDGHWPTLILGYLTMRIDDDSALLHLETAADGFHSQGEIYGEVMARTNARKIHLRRNNLAAASRHTRLARRHAEDGDDPHALARALVLSATHRIDTGGDLGLAYADLHRALAIDVPGSGGQRLRSSILFNLARLAADLGQWDDAIAINRRRLDAMEDQGALGGRAVTALNIALAYQALAERRPQPDTLEALELHARDALRLAQAEDSPTVTPQIHRVLAEVLLSTQPSVARHHLDTCRRLAQAVEDLKIESSCDAIESRRLLAEDPTAALAVGRRAVDLAQRSQSPMFEAHAWRSVMRAAWQASDRATAVDTSQAALASIETLRAAQTDPLSRAQLLSLWASELTWLVGRWLDDDNSDLDEAFAAMERQRSRVLLETTSRPAPRPSQDTESRQARRHIAGLQRRLLNPGLADAERADLLAELERWELEERFAQTAPPADEAPVEFVERRHVQAALRPHEAMLSFQIDPWTDLYGQPAGGAWLLVTTSRGSRSYAIDRPLALEPAISIFLGLVQRRDGSETTIAGSLYDTLLKAALDDLPTATERLILVVDGVLHHLPFAALRQTADTPPLGARYEIVLAPSATLWHRWRRHDVPAPSRSVLALADPRLPIGGGRSATPTTRSAGSRNAVLVDGLRLPQLPHARREGKAILRHMGGRLAVGAEASERYLKDQDLSQYGVLHVASHAVADTSRPERSSLVLSAGALEEDGLLRAPEIADLHLDGRLVVLSACQTTAGELLRAEGILSLARAFFEARAHGVIGSRWPLRDDDAALFFDDFYRHLAAGQSSAGALRAARRDAIAQGLPAATWAAVSLLGDGDLHVTPEDTSSPWSAWWVLALVTSLVAIAVRRRREYRHRP